MDIYGNNDQGSAISFNNPLVFETKYNQVEHEAEFWLDGGAGESDKNRFPINPTSIINLTINDSLADWVTRGHITIMYSPEANASVNNLDGIIDNINYNQYVFRNDGLDLLRVRIKPKNITTGYDPSANPVFWSLSYYFSIYDREEIDLPPMNATTNTLKALKLYFWDCWYQRLKTRVIEYSTALSPQAEFDEELDNGQQFDGADQRVLYTGLAIKDLINIGLSEDGVQIEGTEPQGNLAYALQVPGSGLVSVIDDEKFDTGAAKIFYTTPADTTVYDSIMYLYNKHVSSMASEQVNDFCLLYKEKGPEENDTGLLTLMNMSDFFEKAGNSPGSPGEYQIEHFVLQDFTGDSSSLTKYIRAPRGSGADNDKDITTPEHSYITNYRFVDIAAATNSLQFCDRPVYSYNFNKRQLNVEFANNKTTTARDFIAEKYIEQVYKDGAAVNLFLPILEKDREKNLNVRPVFSNDGDNLIIRQHAGIQKLLKIGVFENAAINFRSPGLTFREPGRFIAIDKLHGAEDGEFQDKLFGQWFIIDIKHIFEAEIYYNDITAIKVHRHKELPIAVPGII